MVLGYIYKLNKIQKKPGSTAIFSISEIVSAIVNLLDAKKQLTTEEFDCVCFIYESYRLIKDKIYLDYHGYIATCFKIIAQFDLIAPYYKFCGNGKLNFEEILEEYKKPYRARAKVLIKKGGIMGDEWVSLYEDFKKEFYKWKN